MHFNFPLHRFQEFGDLDPCELAALAAIVDPPVTVKRGRCIRPEGVMSDGFFLLASGWAAASHIMPDGKRQILKIHLPGDALGTPSMATSHTAEELIAITDVVVVKVPLSAFGRLFDEHPRLVARFMLSIQLERISLMDRIAAIGCTSAEARVAALILDLYDRLMPLGLVTGNAFDLMLTQEQIGDVLGLTAVHVNRTLKVLGARGLIDRAGHRIGIPDRRVLEVLSQRPKRTPAANQAWFPASRQA